MENKLKLYKSDSSNRVVLGYKKYDGLRITPRDVLYGIEVVGRNGSDPSLEYKETWEVDNFKEISGEVRFKELFKNNTFYGWGINKFVTIRAVSPYSGRLDHLCIYFHPYMRHREEKIWYLDTETNKLGQCNHTTFSDIFNYSKTDRKEVILKYIK